MELAKTMPANANNDKSSNSVWRRDVTAWCSYDWANSGFTTLMITAFALYIQRVVFDETSTGNRGAVVWAWSVSAAMLLGAILSPLAGAIADARRSKRSGLAVTAIAGGLSCVLMALIPSDRPWLIVASFVSALFFLELSLTFYNGFLPEIADSEWINRVSSAGMAWGYFGGGLALLLAMIWLKCSDRFVVEDSTWPLRVCILGTGVWWILFTIPSLLVLRDRPAKKAADTPTIDNKVLDSESDNVAGASSRSKFDQRCDGKPQPLFSAINSAESGLKATWNELLTQRTLLLFLIAFLFYNDGVQTVVSQASTFAIAELNFLDQQLAAVILMVQFAATPGAILTGWIADKVGRKKALQFCLTIWIALLVAAWFVQTKWAFWILALGIAIVLGGTQAVSRAIMASLTPPQREARYFGFFNLSGKATSFLGTFSFGLVIAITGSSRIAIVGLLVFFVIGLSIISKLKLPPNTDL